MFLEGCCCGLLFGFVLIGISVFVVCVRISSKKNEFGKVEEGNIISLLLLND